MFHKPRYVEQLKYYEDTPSKGEVEADSINHLDGNYYRPFTSRQLFVNRISECDQIVSVYMCDRSSLCGMMIIVNVLYYRLGWNTK